MTGQTVDNQDKCDDRESERLPQPIVSVVECTTYAPEAVRQALVAVLSPLGGLSAFVRPGMRVLLKPNLLLAADPDRAVTTHPTVIQVVADLVREAGGEAWIGDSPGGPISTTPDVWVATGAARAAGAHLVQFDAVDWRRIGGADYFIAKPVSDADLVINLPKLKTHTFAYYTGAVKNLFGSIPGTRKREAHFRAPGTHDFAAILVDVLELTMPGLTILDGVLGQEGDGPGITGTPHRYNCLAASADPVALDAVVTDAMGFPPGQVAHLALAQDRALGVADVDGVRVVGQNSALDFGHIRLPLSHWYYRMPSALTRPLRGAMRLRPQVTTSACSGCGRCGETCPTNAISPGRPPTFDFAGCVGCMCCSEVCPEGAIGRRGNLLTRLVGYGR